MTTWLHQHNDKRQKLRKEKQAELESIYWKYLYPLNGMTVMFRDRFKGILDSFLLRFNDSLQMTASDSPILTIKLYPKECMSFSVEWNGKREYDHFDPDILGDYLLNFVQLEKEGEAQ